MGLTSRRRRVASLPSNSDSDPNTNHLPLPPSVVMSSTDPSGLSMASPPLNPRSNQTSEFRRALRLHPIRPPPEELPRRASQPLSEKSKRSARKADRNHRKKNRDRNNPNDSSGQVTEAEIAAGLGFPRRWSEGDVEAAPLPRSPTRKPSFAPASEKTREVLGSDPDSARAQVPDSPHLLPESDPYGFSTRRRDMLVEEAAKLKLTGSSTDSKNQQVVSPRTQKQTHAALASAAVMPRRPSFTPKPPPETAKASSHGSVFAALAGLVRRPSFTPSPKT